MAGWSVICIDPMFHGTDPPKILSASLTLHQSTCHSSHLIPSDANECKSGAWFRNSETLFPALYVRQSVPGSHIKCWGPVTHMPCTGPGHIHCCTVTTVALPSSAASHNIQGHLMQQPGTHEPEEGSKDFNDRMRDWQLVLAVIGLLERWCKDFEVFRV